MKKRRTPTTARAIRMELDAAGTKTQSTKRQEEFNTLGFGNKKLEKLTRGKRGECKRRRSTTDERNCCRILERRK